MIEQGLLSNRYRLDSELGQGGMGVVYRGHDTLLDRPVAVKLLRDGSPDAPGQEAHSRLLREAQAAARLNHPNSVATYDIGAGSSPDSQPFIVMELVEGQSLHSRRPASMAEMLSIIRQVTAALDHAHTHGIIHRDLKPENILVSTASPAWSS